MQFNDRLADDFPEVTHPIRRLEGIQRRAEGQIWDGHETRIGWGKKRVAFATLPEAVWEGGPDASGSTVCVAGLTGALRGLSHTLVSGEVIRPELVILDDPQTRDSAISPTQTAHRLSIVVGDVLGMAGPTKKIAALMPCTVIQDGDLADCLLDRIKYPQWRGERTKAVYSWPVEAGLWDDYHRIRNDCMRRGESPASATDFYRANRAAMDRGAVVAWPARYFEDELSAVQNVQNLRADLGEEAFASEFQNEPIRPRLDDSPALTAAITGRLSGVPRGTVPDAAAVLTASIDVHDTILFWSVSAWAAGGTGWVVDYGTFPEQPARSFTARRCPRPLSVVFPGMSTEAAIRAGLSTLPGSLLGREWGRESGTGFGSNAA